MTSEERLQLQEDRHAIADLKARYVETYKTASGPDTRRLVTVATSREETLQSGKLILVSLGDDEATASSQDLTPLVPGGEGPSSLNIGRYYDAEILGPPADRRFLVSWADGPVQAMVLEQAGLPVEGFALIIGVDRLLDMVRTAVNVTGDATVSVIVGKSEKQFDEVVYLNPNADAEGAEDVHRQRGPGKVRLDVLCNDARESVTRKRSQRPTEGDRNHRAHHERGGQRLRLLLASRSRSSFRRSAMRCSRPRGTGS